MGICWANGERLVIANADGTLSEVLAGEARTAATTRLALAGHALFTRSDGAGLAECARAYRAALLEAAEGAEDATEGGEDASQLYAAHVVWEFCEAVYLSDDLDDEDDVATRLGHWYRSNYGDLHAATEAFHDAPDAPASDGEDGEVESDEEDGDGGDGDSPPRLSTDARLWRLVTRLVAAGSRLAASSLLSARLAAVDPPASPPHPLAIATQLLGACPDAAPARTRANGEWAAWQDSAAAWLESLSSGALAPHPPLAALLTMLGGNPGAPSVTRLLGSWEEALLAHLAYGRGVGGGGSGGGGGGGAGGGRQPRAGGVGGSTSVSLTYGAMPPPFGGGGGTPVAAVAAASAAACVAHPPPEGVCGGALTEAALGNPAEALLRLAASTATAWHSAHLGDLLLRAGALPNVPSALAPAGGGGGGGGNGGGGGGSSVVGGMGRHAVATRDAFLTALATGLAWRPATWRIAVDYLSLLSAASPGAAAAGALPSLIAGVPATAPGGGGEPALLKALSLASPAGRRRLAARAAAASAAAGNPAAEVYWLTRGGLHRRAVAAADAALRGVLVVGKDGSDVEGVAGRLLAAAAAGGVGGVVTALAHVAGVRDVYACLDGGGGGGGGGGGDGEVPADAAAATAVVATVLPSLPDGLRGVVAYDVARRGRDGLAADALYAVVSALEGEVSAAGGERGLLAKRLAAVGGGEVADAVDTLREGVLRQLAGELLRGEG